MHFYLTSFCWIWTSLQKRNCYGSRGNDQVATWLLPTSPVVVWVANALEVLTILNRFYLVFLLLCVFISWPFSFFLMFSLCSAFFLLCFCISLSVYLFTSTAYVALRLTHTHTHSHTYLSPVFHLCALSQGERALCNEGFMAIRCRSFVENTLFSWGSNWELKN